MVTSAMNTIKINMNDDGTFDVYVLDEEETLLANEEKAWGEEHTDVWVFVKTVPSFRVLSRTLREYDPLR